jgi:hypothetical protein
MVTYSGGPIKVVPHVSRTEEHVWWAIANCCERRLGLYSLS